LHTWPRPQAPNFGESSVSVFVAFICLLLNVATFLGEVATYQPWNCEPGPVYLQPSVGQTFIGFTAFAYAFGGHGMYPEEVREMRNPKEWPKVVNFTYVTVCSMYAICAYVGYYAYGTAARANLNSNFPNNALNAFSIIVQLVVTYYCIYVTSLVMLLHIEEHAFGINPRASCGEYTTRTALVRLFFRTAFVGLQVLLCWLLVGVKGDVLLSMQSLSGAIGMTALTYVLPYMLHWMLHPERVTSVRMRAWYVLNICVAVVIMVGGTWFGLKGMVEGLFADKPDDELTCHLEFMYSPISPCDACYQGGLPERYYDLPRAWRNETCDALFDDDVLRR
jgi:amino acid permease